MIYLLPDDQRMLLFTLAIRAAFKHPPEGDEETVRLDALLKLLGGTDTKVWIEKP